MTARPPFGARLAAAMADRGPVCVGIDPSPGLLAEWGQPDDATGLRSFVRQVLDEIAPHAAAIKPQAAFFERHGAAGIAVLEEAIATGQAAGSLVVLDAKRGDIGSTMSAYADAYLRDGSPLAADAVTVSPFLGFGSLRPAVDLALASGRGLFVLALTSNPEGPAVQHARGADGRTVAATIAAAAADVNAGADPYGSIGLVIGATVGDAIATAGLDLVELNGPILAPGVGAQGATTTDIKQVFTPVAHRVLVPVSRSLLAAGPGNLREALVRLNDGLTG